MPKMPEVNRIYNIDCVSFMQDMPDNSVDFVLTDIPYDAVNRPSNGLRILDKENADIITFDLSEFCDQVWRVVRNPVCIFLGKEQFSPVFDFFAKKPGTTRCVVWDKTNPSPMNGQYVYLSGVELAVWHKKRGGKVFNAHCKNSVFRHPNGRRKYHPTEKNSNLFTELLLDNTNEGDIVFDPCIGSGTTALCAIRNNRQFLGCELSKEYFDIANQRIKELTDLNVVS